VNIEYKLEDDHNFLVIVAGEKLHEVYQMILNNNGEKHIILMKKVPEFLGEPMISA